MKDSLFILVQHLLPQHLLSRCAGKLADCKLTAIKNPFIRWFVSRYQVDMSQAEETEPTAYPSFNAFFTRALKQDARPLPFDDTLIVSPADGTISQLGAVEEGRLLQAKGRDFCVKTLLGGDLALAEEFQGGNFATIYLSPRDYHRVHMPMAGILREMIYVPGKLFSVNQLTSQRVNNLFTRNERAVCIFDTDAGPMALVLVGAMIVAGIETVWSGQVAPAPHGLMHNDYTQHSPPVQIARGAEMGRFKLGSTVIAVFGPGMSSLKKHLSAGDTVKMGHPLGTLLSDHGN